MNLTIHGFLALKTLYCYCHYYYYLIIHTFYQDHHTSHLSLLFLLLLPLHPICLFISMLTNVIHPEEEHSFVN